MRCRIVHDPELHYAISIDAKDWSSTHFSSHRVLWHPDGAGDQAQARTPVEKERTLRLRAFVAGGATYHGVEELAHTKLKDPLGDNYSLALYRDLHGRPVVEEYEHVPYFDSYDAMYDKRAYYWYYLFAEDRLVRVGHAVPDVATVYVTEDVSALSENVYRALVKEGCVDADGWLTLPT